MKIVYLLRPARLLFCLIGWMVFAPSLRAQPGVNKADSIYVRENYTKIERLIPMRDGIKLFTSIYLPKNTTQKYPILLGRTPYSVAPYGEDKYKTSLGPSMVFARDGYIFVYQDVRGKWMSEGEFVAVRPHNPNKKKKTDIDESTDTYDTIDWLIKNLPNNNGRVGTWGISAPGFYTTMTAIDAHPALKAVSPQAPVTDWFMGDDRHHNGAFFLMGTFAFLSSYGKPRPEPTSKPSPGFSAYGTPDSYQFYKGIGPLSKVNERYFNGQNKIWQEMIDHPNYDDFWQARTPVPHLKNIKPAVLTVGGWFDQEDLYGPLKTYAAIEQQNPNAQNKLVMGPWIHGGWARSNGDGLGNIRFGSKTAPYYREKIELPFFNHYLKDGPDPQLAEATIFLTGANEWKQYSQWPPKESQERNLYLHPNGKLSFEPPKETEPVFDEYLSDPKKPVPYTNNIQILRGSDFMYEDQRFAAARPDVLVYESEPLTEDLTITGNVLANLFVATTGTDADFVVKLIDVYPDTTKLTSPIPTTKMGGFQLMVRGEVMRAKFRNSFSKPEPLKPGEVTEVKFDMQDAAHTFKKGHKLMVQVQSSWFPLVDRNPQKFMNIYDATDADYQKATHRVYFSTKAPSHVKVRVLDKGI
ncbi:CocE/NonD family hydrolase [Larkinella sp. VNQ87]|uniref:CocE/NonD family hydrolase n=1 Tax=Larkinella sp. VNQ87 TaxID=3400921 RepID=UPI003BFC14C8